MRARLVAVVLSLFLVLAAGPAHASDAEDRITRYDMWIDIAADGVAQVVLDLDVDFGHQANHGPYLTWQVRQYWDETYDVVAPIRDVRASSPTADATVVTETSGDDLAIRIGSEDRTYTGVHSYRVSFQVEGWVGSVGRIDGITEDEVYRNLITGWEIPVENVTVRVMGPVPVTSAECFAVAGTNPCTSAEVRAGAAVMTQDQVAPGSPMTVLVKFPAGTFGGVAPILDERWNPATAFSLTPATGGLALALGGGLTALVLRRSRRVGADEHFAGLTPGLMPTGADHPVTDAGGGAVAVRFTPPEGLRPGQVGTVIDERADVADVTATVVDLAVRGYLRIVETSPAGSRAKDKEWRFDWIAPSTQGLVPYELMLVEKIFQGQASRSLADLRTTFATSMAEVRSELYRDVTAAGWFRGNPQHARWKWGGASAVAILVAGVAAVLLAVLTHWGLVGLALLVPAIVMAARTGAAPARTATGSAVTAQAEGFRRYLSVAEGDQLRFEEDQDRFSRYLPFAIAFGVTERWTRVFQDLAARGHPMAEPTWYVGAWGYGAFWSGAGDLSETFAGFAKAAGDSFTAPDPSSGSSGGGSAGGGGGGGGGGTW